MQIPDTPNRKARIEIVPMIDTMFFLLVFFMIATLSMTIQRGLSVTLPPAASVSQQVDDNISLTIKHTGVLYFNKEPLSLRELEMRLASLRNNDQHPRILINADERVYHGLVVEVLDRVRLSGFTKTAIAIKPKRP